VSYRSLGPLVRLYGPSVNHDSWSRVARGMRTGLERLGLLAGFYELEGAVRDLDDGMPVGSDCPWGVFVGPPSVCGVLRGRGSHEHRAVMIAANSSWLPKKTMETISKAATHILTPSCWAQSVVESHGPGLPVDVWNHGVDDAFRPIAEAPAHAPDASDRPFLVLHMASTIKERKSTEQLVRGWVQAMRDEWLPLDSRLDIVLSGPYGDLLSAVQEESQGDVKYPASIRFLSRLNLSERAAAELYQNYALVCQPSRAEGFGLVPLEARACGVPVCVTLCTGHQEHMSRGQAGVVRVPHGEDGPVDDGPGAIAPTVDAVDIAEMIGVAYTGRETYHHHALAAAPEIRQQWSWEAVTRRWADRL
jgi:glycosyltransferase involved in cell wall biosynthesis